MVETVILACYVLKLDNYLIRVYVASALRALLDFVLNARGGGHVYV